MIRSKLDAIQVIKEHYPPFIAERLIKRMETSALYKEMEEEQKREEKFQMEKRIKSAAVEKEIEAEVARLNDLAKQRKDAIARDPGVMDAKQKLEEFKTMLKKAELGIKITRSALAAYKKEAGERIPRARRNTLSNLRKKQLRLKYPSWA